MVAGSTLAEWLRRLGEEWTAPIERFDSLGSTNDYLKEQAVRLPAWSVVVADRQTAGRGRTGHAWHSPAGNLHLSVLLRPREREARLGVLTLGVGVVVAGAIEALAPGVEVRLKWPNDLIAAGAKLGGILCEGIATGGGVVAVVVGIGVNVAVAPDPALVPGASSLHALGAAAADADRLAAGVLSGLRRWYDGGPFEPAGVVAQWRARSVDWWGSEVEVQSPDGLLRGVARKVDDAGALVIELPDGATRRILSGEVRRLRRAGGGEGR